MQDPWPLLLLLLLLVAVAVVVAQSWRLQRQRAVADRYRDAAAREQNRQVAAQERAARAIVGEGDAPALLGRAGYSVLGRQVAGSWTVRANGALQTFGLRADYLVGRDGRRYIAEVKTGKLAPSLSHGATRRQLLEYGVAFDVDGVILVDADRETLTHVEIEPLARDGAEGRARHGPARSRSQSSVVVVVAIGCFAVGVAVGRVMIR